MNAIIKKGVLSGAAAAPVSKSSLHRLLICSAFSDKKTKIYAKDGPTSDDVLATIRCLNALGADISEQSGVLTVKPCVTPPEKAILPAGESGSTLRFLVPVAAALGVSAEFHMEGRLPYRPMKPLSDVLFEHGARVAQDGDVLTVEGKIGAGEYRVRADVSSQFVSGLLFALPLVGGGSVVLTGKPESSGYLDMTSDAFRRFGVRSLRDADTITIPSGGFRSPGTAAAEGDWSGAAFLLCSGAAGNGPVTVTGLDPDSRQGDRRIVRILREMGANVTEDGDSVTVAGGDLHGITLDAADIPDLVPPVAALAVAARGTTVFREASRLRMKETDRLATILSSLTALGADVSETLDGLVIRGSGRIPGGVADSYGDHRIAMAAAVASAVSDGPVTVNGAECVSKSYPSFWDDFEKLGGVVDRA